MLSVTIADSDPQVTYSSQVVVPIIASGDSIGAIMLLDREDSTAMQATEMKVCETAACFLGKQMEN